MRESGRQEGKFVDRRLPIDALMPRPQQEQRAWELHLGQYGQTSAPRSSNVESGSHATSHTLPSGSAK